MLSNINSKCHLGKGEEFKTINITVNIKKAGLAARWEDFIHFKIIRKNQELLLNIWYQKNKINHNHPLKKSSSH